MNMDQLKIKMERWRRTAPNHLKRFLRKGAKLVTKEVQSKHLSGPQMQRGMGDPLNATLAVQTGRLRRGISERVTVSKDGVRARVGTNIFYGKLHEEGIGKMPERPFLRPSVMEKKPQFVKLILQGMMEAYKRG
jgi:HK97 gp10 family phage protein